MEEVDKTLKDMVANQKQSDARIAELEAKLQDEHLRIERLEVTLSSWIISLREKPRESDRKTSQEENLNKDSERGESEATLRGQKKPQGSKIKTIKGLMENMQGLYTEVKHMGKDWKIARQIKGMRRQNPGPSQANERPA
jgi:uncharacterized protein (UPF0335 family)